MSRCLPPNRASRRFCRMSSYMSSSPPCPANVCARAPHAPQTSVLEPPMPRKRLSKLPKIPAWPLQPAHADHHSPTHALLNPWLAAAHAPHALYLHDLEKVLHKYSTRCIGFDPSSTFSKVLHFACNMGTCVRGMVRGTLYAAHCMPQPVMVATVGVALLVCDPAHSSLNDSRLVI